MIYVGIDVAKDKHDCYITNSEGDVLFRAFTISNNLDGFDELYQKILSITDNLAEVKIGLEATGHYNFNLLGYLMEKGLPTYVMNPLHTNMYRKSLSLRQTKTDRVDARTIALMLMSDVNLKVYSQAAYDNEDLKSLTRYRQDKVRERARLKTSISRLVTVLFPELEDIFPTVHSVSVYALLVNLPGAALISSATLSRVSAILSNASKGRFDNDTAKLVQATARKSIGANMPSKSLELKHTIKLVQELNSEIDEVEERINIIMDKIHSPILTIPGISYRLGAIIIAEIGDINRFASADKLLAYAGLSPSTYQSGQLNSTYSHMEKRGSKYLRYALFNATKLVCRWDANFAAYLAKKRAEGKHYNVAVSHAAKKLVRVIYHLEKSGQIYKAG
jgi:transposase